MRYLLFAFLGGNTIEKDELHQKRCYFETLINYLVGRHGDGGGHVGSLSAGNPNYFNCSSKKRLLTAAAAAEASLRRKQN